MNLNILISICVRVLTAPVLAAILTSARADTITAKTIRPERELFITDSAVVDSYVATYPGAWSFGALIEEIVGKENASHCIAEWLDTWRVGTVENELAAPRRPAIFEQIIQPWQRRDGYDPESEVRWNPKLENAPFRLCAIVNRMDLCAPDLLELPRRIAEEWRRRGLEKRFDLLVSRVGATSPLVPAPSPGLPSGYGGCLPTPSTSVSAGQGRLIFTATDGEGNPLAGDWMVIFEYQLPSSGRLSPRGWAQEWHRLAQLDPKTHEFVLALEQLTRGFTHRSGSSGQVSLAQIRTSEAAFHPDREFREFRVKNNSLVLSPLPLTPAPDFAKAKSREGEALGTFLHEQEPLIRSGLHLLPGTISDRKGSMQLAALRAVIPADQPDFHWDPGHISRETRRIVSLNTCNGCHAGETGCRDGLHLHGRPAWLPSQTSQFLKTDGKPLRVKDPAGAGSTLEYNEMGDREAIFAALLEPRDRKQLDELTNVLRARLRRSH